MIKKLRRKFILINMLLVFVVLAAVCAGQFYAAYQQVLETSTRSLYSTLSWSESEPPRFQFDRHIVPSDEADADADVQPAQKIIQSHPLRTAEMRMAQIIFLPTFLVNVDTEGATTIVRGGNADVTEDLARELTQEALSLDADSGILQSSGLRFARQLNEDGTAKVAFVSRTWEAESIWNQVSSILLICGAALVGFFFISLFLSGVAVKPVERSWEQQRQFVADASHELKTPLTVILTNTNILLSHPDDPISKHSKWLEDCQSEAHQMKGLVDDMLFLAKNDAAQTPKVYGEVDFSDLLLSCCLTFESVAFESKITLDSDVAPGLRLMADGDDLRRLAGILLDNACKYAGPDGHISVRLTGERDEARLVVHNTGAPIPPAHLEHLFDRFYRADAARSRQDGGYGLGLAIAKSIVETHKGRISVTSGETGTTFNIFLPLHTLSASAADASMV